MGMNSLAAYLQLQEVWVYDLPLQVVWVKMRFKMALRYLTDSKQETTLCLIHFQKLFDNEALKMRFENPLTLFNRRFWLVNQKKRLTPVASLYP